MLRTGRIGKTGGRAAAAILALALALPAAIVSPPAAGAGRADHVRDQVLPVLNALEVPRAWGVTKGRGATVAVLDSGVDPGQADLAGSVTTGPDYAKGANPPGVAPARLHGTVMASIIAGHGHGSGRGDGVIGVAPEARLLSVRVILENDEPGFALFNSNERFEASVAKGIRHAADRGVDVINLSLGRTAPTKEERQAVVYAIGKGSVVVAAAGNEGATARARRSGHAPFAYPASYPGVISVAAVDGAGRHAGFSNRNSAVMVSAPGVKIAGAGPGSEYWVTDGTSPATALVSGIAALIRAKFPKLPPAAVAQAVAASTGRRSGYDSGVGFGRVNAAAALTEATRLSGARAAGLGLPADRRFGSSEAVESGEPGGSGPVQVVRRDTGLITTYGAIGGVAGALGVVSLVAAIVLAARRRPREPQAPPPHPWIFEERH